MTSPPLQADTTTAVNAQLSIGNLLTKSASITAAMRDVDLRYPLNYPDPVGEEAIRSEARKIREQVGWQPRTVNKLVMGRDKIPVHISDDLADKLFLFLAMEAELKPTHSGNGFRASQKKNTLTAAKFGDYRGEGQTENNC